VSISGIGILSIVDGCNVSIVDSCIEFIVDSDNVSIGESGNVSILDSLYIVSNDHHFVFDMDKIEHVLFVCMYC
jgi:hypothetical protein